MSLQQDLKRFILDGTPHSIAFYVVHFQILRQFIDTERYGFSKRSIDNGRYYTLVTSNFLHDGLYHLEANTKGFVPCCHRMIGYLDENNKWRSACIFWCIYFASGIMANIGDYLLTSSWKSLLLLYFRNDPTMIKDINQRFDVSNWKETKAIGASGCVYALDAFNLCISIELVIKRLHFMYRLFQDDRFDSNDFETDFEDDDECDTGLLQKEHVQYHSIKLGIDILWLIKGGLDIYHHCLKRIHRDWQYRKQQRAGRDYMVAFSGMVGDYTHLCGVLSGTIMYAAYKLFTDHSRSRNII
eukprot:270502_1